MFNIAFVVRKYSTSGGTERHVYTISKKLAEIGNKITIICNKTEISPPYPDIKIKKLFPPLAGRIIKTAGFFIQTKFINLNDYDIVQGCGKIARQDIYRAGGGFHKLYLRYQKKRKNFTLYDRIVIKIEKEIYNPLNTKAIIAVSNFIKDEIINEFNYPEERIFVFYNCVDLETFLPLNINNHFRNDLRLIFVANDFQLKGLSYIIESLKYIDDITLDVVGKDNPERFLKLAQKYGVDDRVNFLGGKNTLELVEIYQNSDLLVHPTSFDPFSNVCLEAMACGLPVITTEVNGASEIITDYRDGIVIKYPVNVKELISAISYFKNREKLIEAKVNAYRKAKEFSVNRYVEKLIELYKEVKKWKRID